MTNGRASGGPLLQLARMAQGIRTYWLPLGLVVFLTAPFWAPTRDAMKTNTYIFLLLPALLLMLDYKAVYRAVAHNTAFCLLLVFVAIMSLSSIWAVTEHDEGVPKKMLYVFIFLYGLGFQLARRERTLLVILCIAIGACALGAVTALFMQATTPQQVTMDGRIYGYGPLVNPLLSGNLYGCYLVLLLGIVICAATRWWHALAALLAGAAIFAFIAATHSRSPLLALAIAATAMLLQRRDVKILKLWAVAAAIAGFAAAISWEVLSERGLSLRPQIWWNSIQLCLQKPWLGYGAETLVVVAADDGSIWNNTHNIGLTIWYYAGLPALVVWIALHVVLLRGLWRARGPIATCALGLLVYGMTTTFFDGGGMPGRPTEFWYQVWLPMGLALWAGAGQCRTGSPGIS